MHEYALHKTYSEIQAGSGRTAGAEKRQCDADNRQKAENHSEVYNKLASNQSKVAEADTAAERIV